MNFDLEQIIRKNIKGLQPYSSARDEFVSDRSGMIFLDANENPFENGVNRYPDPQQRSLKAVLANLRGVNAQHILLGNGSDEVLDLLFRAFCEPKIDHVITLPPTYGMYKVLASINDVENREEVLTNDFQPNIDGILKGINSHSKMLFICSPNNPTGNSISEEKILKLLQNFNGLVVVDEAYIDFSPKQSWATRVTEFPNLVVTQTLSKAFGMAGIRLGICIASKEIISVLNKIKPPYNINSLTQLKALERISTLNDIEKEIANIQIEKSTLIRALKRVLFVKNVYDSDANFILIKVDNAAKRYAQLLAKGIVVRNRSTQALCENTLRISIGTSEENKKLIAILKDMCNE